MKKLALLALTLAAVALVFSACTDAGDPYVPGNVTVSASIMVDDMVGDWDNLHVNGALTGDSPVAMTADGIIWSATISGLGPGTYAYGLYYEDGSKAMVAVREGLEIVVDDNYAISGDTDVELDPEAGTGFRLLVINHRAEEYDNIKIKGSYDGWATVQRDGQSADGMYVYRNIAAGLEAGDYNWGAIHDDGSEWGIWLPESDIPFTVAADGTVTGTTTFEIEAATPPVDVTFMVDMSAETVSGDGMRIAGSFGGDGYAEWTPGAIIMTDEDEDNVYEVTLTLSSDTEYEFVYINGTTWDGQEAVPSDCGVDNNNGGFNRYLTTGTTAMTYTAVFGACPAGK
jgi:hypothetical protein